MKYAYIVIEGICLVMYIATFRDLYLILLFMCSIQLKLELLENKIGKK